MCQNEEIRTALPALLEGSLEGSMRMQVEAHLASCADCAAELALLRELAAQPVPDPGEAFWAAMPGKVARELQQAGTAGRPGKLAEWLAGLALPRWGWATAVVLIAALAAWYVAAPQHGRMRDSLAKRGAAPQVRVVEDPASLTGVRPRDLGQLSSWAHRELLSAQKDLEEPVLGSSMIDNGLDDDLVALDQKQLDELVRKLRAGGQEG